MAQYATVEDLEDTGLPPEALKGTTPARLNKFLDRSGDMIDTYLRQQHTLPITGSLNDATTTPPNQNTYPGELIRCNVILAAYDILQWQGYNPDEFDEKWRERSEDCIAWLEQLASGALSLDDALDATPTVNEGAPAVHGEGSPRTFAVVETSVKRGW